MPKWTESVDGQRRWETLAVDVVSSDAYRSGYVIGRNVEIPMDAEELERIVGEINEDASSRCGRECVNCLVTDVDEGESGSSIDADILETVASTSRLDPECANMIALRLMTMGLGQRARARALIEALATDGTTLAGSIGAARALWLCGHVDDDAIRMRSLDDEYDSALAARPEALRARMDGILDSDEKRAGFVGLCDTQPVLASTILDEEERKPGAAGTYPYASYGRQWLDAEGAMLAGGWMVCEPDPNDMTESWYSRRELLDIGYGEVRRDLEKARNPKGHAQPAAADRAVCEGAEKAHRKSREEAEPAGAVEIAVGIGFCGGCGSAGMSTLTLPMDEEEYEREIDGIRREVEGRSGFPVGEGYVGTWTASDPATASIASAAFDDEVMKGGICGIGDANLLAMRLAMMSEEERRRAAIVVERVPPASTAELLGLCDDMDDVVAIDLDEAFDEYAPESQDADRKRFSDIGKAFFLVAGEPELFCVDDRFQDALASLDSPKEIEDMTRSVIEGNGLEIIDGCLVAADRARESMRAETVEEARSRVRADWDERRPAEEAAGGRKDRGECRFRARGEQGAKERTRR